jgi:2-dehydro-3-deoxyphosphooctonate aldolase (KDO 8-P synthase)
MEQVLGKLDSTGNDKVWLTERGASFGYNNLVVDMRSIPIMGDFGRPVVFDATHSVQIPGGRGCASGGRREFVAPLAGAAVAAGANGVFMEVHPDPDNALCDGPNSLPLDRLEPLVRKLLALWETAREDG